MHIDQPPGWLRSEAQGIAAQYSHPDVALLRSGALALQAQAAIAPIGSIQANPVEHDLVQAGEVLRGVVLAQGAGILAKGDPLNRLVPGLPLEECTPKRPQGKPCSLFRSSRARAGNGLPVDQPTDAPRDSATDFEALSVARNASSLFNHRAFTTTTAGASVLAEQREA
ncbi:MAG: hypothetical protein J0M13_06650 [Candidatus Accumulibacter sp.]|nr:hypothetical protein [Candidatus Accumulibacter necessarius]